MPNSVIFQPTGSDTELLMSINSDVSTGGMITGSYADAIPIEIPTGCDTGLAAEQTDWYTLELHSSGIGQALRTRNLRCSVFNGERLSHWARLTAPKLDELSKWITAALSAEWSRRVFVSFSAVECARFALLSATEGEPPGEPEVPILRFAAETPPAARIRQASGLDAMRLGGIFGVSRATFHQWLNGAVPRGNRLDHLLETIPMIELAAERLGDSDQVSAWLRTPVSASGRKPIDLLRDRKYDAFRGFLMRVPLEQRLLRRPLPSRSRRHLSKEDTVDKMQAVGRNVWPDDISTAKEGG